jgi:hypothetical protein
MVTYCILKVRFPQLNREYQSPTGIPGAIYAAVVFALAFVGAVSHSASGLAPPPSTSRQPALAHDSILHQVLGRRSLGLVFGFRC